MGGHVQTPFLFQFAKKLALHAQSSHTNYDFFFFVLVVTTCTAPVHKRSNFKLTCADLLRGVLITSSYAESVYIGPSGPGDALQKKEHGTAKHPFTR